MRQFAYWYLDKLYTAYEIAEIVKLFENNFTPDLKDQPADDIEKTAVVKIADWYKVKHVLERAQQAAKFINSTQIGYDLYDMTDYHCANYNVYNSQVQGKYDWHVDASKDSAPTDIKLTVILNVSTTQYTGGEFEIFKQGAIKVPEINMPGTAIVFPGFWNHRVLPVTSGVRRTVSFWIEGPKFR
jgi:PKHD-type hydroxylase